MESKRGGGSARCSLGLECSPKWSDRCEGQFPCFSGLQSFTKSLGDSHDLQILIFLWVLFILSSQLQSILATPLVLFLNSCAAHSLGNSTTRLLFISEIISNFLPLLFNHEVLSAKTPFLLILPTDYIRLSKISSSSWCISWNLHLEYISSCSPGMRYFISTCSWFIPYCAFYNSCIWAYSFYPCENVKSMKVRTSFNLSVISHST